MEPITTNAENLELDQEIADPLEYIMQDFNKFREKITLLNSDGAINYEELVDLYITHGHGSDNADLPQSTRHQFTELLQDFNEYENPMLPPYQVESNNMQDKNDSYKTTIETQDSEMASVTCVDTRGSCVHTFPSMQITSDNDRNGVNVITYSNMTHYGAACGGGGGEILQGPFASAGCRTKHFLTQACTSTSRWKRIKRRYKGVIETEEETRYRLEQAKIKNREATAKAQAKRKAREAALWTQYLKLRQKNEFRKKLITFLEGHERINLPPKPLRRAISGPISISNNGHRS